MNDDNKGIKMTKDEICYVNGFVYCIYIGYLNIELAKTYL